jgi:hypothetical protein
MQNIYFYVHGILFSKTIRKRTHVTATAEEKKEEGDMRRALVYEHFEYYTTFLL